MDFFDVIEEYENKISNDIKKRLMLNLEHITQSYQSSRNNKLYDEIVSSEAISELIAEKKKRNKKTFIYAFDAIKGNAKINGCFNQIGFNNDYFYNQKSECEFMKLKIIKDIAKEIESIYIREKRKASCYMHNPTKVLNPIKMNKGNRYKDDNMNMNNYNNNKKTNQENRLNKIKQDNMILMKQRLNQLVKNNEDLLMKTNRAKEKMNFQNKFDIKGKNKKRILSCRVVIQDNNGGYGY